MIRGKRVHFVGIGGIAMSGLARIVAAKGHRVTGSDARITPLVRLLEEGGIGVFSRQEAANISSDVGLVIVSPAIPEDHPEVVEAHRLKVSVVRHSRLLGHLMSSMRGIAIAGTHGKTTTTAMTAHVLVMAGADPTYLVGGWVPQLGGNCGVGKGPFLVAEACEYKRSFHDYRPFIALINNIELEHLDCYRDLEEIQEAFCQFAGNVPPAGALIVHGDVAHRFEGPGRVRCRIETFGSGPGVHWRVVDVSPVGRGRRFRLLRGRDDLGEFRIVVPGRHNVENAAGAIAVAVSAGIEVDRLRKAIAGFTGVERRFQILHDQGITVVDDYGHHPTEIRVVLRLARRTFPGRRLWCVFQPHQHSRTLLLMEDFARSFEYADRIVVSDIYGVRDGERLRQAVHARDLAARIRQHGKQVCYVPGFAEILDLLGRSLETNDVVVTLGAGTIDQVAHSLVARIACRPHRVELLRIPAADGSASVHPGGKMGMVPPSLREGDNP